MDASSLLQFKGSPKAEKVFVRMQWAMTPQVWLSWTSEGQGQEEKS